MPTDNIETMVYPDIALESTKIPLANSVVANQDPWSLLSYAQSQIARLAVTGMSYREIGEATEPPVSISTVRTHLHNIYKKLDVLDKRGLAIVLNSTPDCLEGVDISGLRYPERQVFGFAGTGHTIKQTGKTLGMRESTVRNHHLALRRKLGGLNNQVELVNVATAFVKKTSDAAITVQEAVRNKLAQTQHLLTATGRTKIDNKVILATLREHGYIDDIFLKRGVVGSVGLMAKGLLQEKETAGLLVDPHTSPFAAEVIEQEVRWATRQQS